MNLWPSGYEPDELPDCSTPQQKSRRIVPKADHVVKPCDR